jgi:hypothetical protein
MVIAAGLVGSFVAGVMADRFWLMPAPSAAAGSVSSVTSDVVAATSATDLEVFNEVWKMVQDQYYHQPVDRARVVRAAIKGMVDALEDEHSHFLTPEENEPARNQLQGHFDGIGVWLDTEGGQLRIIAPMDGSPAQRGGVRSNDVIVRVDGRVVTGLKTDEALKLIRGKAGTMVRLGLQRPGRGGGRGRDRQARSRLTPSLPSGRQYRLCARRSSVTRQPRSLSGLKDRAPVVCGSSSTCATTAAAGLVARRWWAVCRRWRGAG